MTPKPVEPKNNIELCDVGVMLNTGNNGRISVHFGGPHVSLEDSLDLYYDGELDADGRQTKYDEIEAKLKKLGWSPLKIHVESYQGNKMTLDKLPLKLSEETQYKLAKALYNEDGAGNGSGNGGLASASDLGPLPMANFGGTGLGFETRRRRNRMQSEEGYDGDVAKALSKFREWRLLDEDDAPAQLQDDNEGPAPAPKPDNAETEATDEGLIASMRKLTSLFEGGVLDREPEYMVSWSDPRITDNSALHKKQQSMNNGLHYVMFGNKGEAQGFYKELKDKGIFNIKIDTLG